MGTRGHYCNFATLLPNLERRIAVFKEGLCKQNVGPFSLRSNNYHCDSKWWYNHFMIISVSRRTDIPAFYAEWFINRIRAGYCAVPNPFHPEQVSRVSLLPADVDCFVFCTRNPRPLMRHLDELDALRHRYYFQYTVIGYPKAIDPASPPLDAALRTFRELSARVGPERMVWRYDPITISEVTPVEFHLERFAAIAAALEGHAGRCVISVLDPYRKIEGRLNALAAQGIHLTYRPELSPAVQASFLAPMADMARGAGMEIVSCAEETGWEQFGIGRGKCIDDELIHRACGLRVTGQKNPIMRATCGCVVSRDIGMYDSCLHGCACCYATTSFDRARKNRAAHDPRSPSLLGWVDAPAEEAAPSAQLRLPML